MYGVGNAETRKIIAKAAPCCVRRKKKAATDTGRELHARIRPGDCGSRGGEGFALPHLRRLDGGEERGGLQLLAQRGGGRRQGQEQERGEAQDRKGEELREEPLLVGPAKKSGLDCLY